MIKYINSKGNRIIHLLPEAETFSQYYGGALSRWTGNVLYCSRQKLNSVVICPDADDSWINNKYVKLNAFKLFKILPTKLHFSKRLWFIRAFLLLIVFSNIKKIVKEHDVLYVHNRPEYVVILGFLRKLWKIEFYIVLHMQNSHLAQSENLCKKRVLSNTDKIIFCSNFLLEEFWASTSSETHSRIKSFVVPNGANPKLFYPIESSKKTNFSNEYTILFVGRLILEKGIHVLIDAVNILKKQGWNVHLRIVGAKSFKGWTNDSYITSLNKKSVEVEEWIKFSGHKSGLELAEEYQKATIFCCPSIWDEPFGMVNIEAMASGLPVVASNVGGIPEIFKDGGGILVPPNDPIALSKAIELLLKDKDYREQIGKQGQKNFMQHFTWSKVTDLYIDNLREYWQEPITNL